MKLLWKIIKSSNILWSKLVKKKCSKNQDIMKHKVYAVASLGWKKFTSLRLLFKKGLRWHIGDGKSISFWDDKWIFQYPISLAVKPVADTADLKVGEVINRVGDWDFNKLVSLVSRYSYSCGSIFPPFSSYL